MIPVLWQSDAFVVQTHDVFSILALVVGLGLYYRSLHGAGMLDERIILASLAVVIGGVVGARLVTAWEHLDYYSDAIQGGAPLGWIVEHSGKSILGALAGGYLAGAMAKRALGYSGSTADHYALAIAVASAIGRIGCFLSELPLGTATTLPWGVSVPSAAAAAFVRCPDCAVAMHPSMLYEVLFNVAAAVAIVRMGHRVAARGDLLRLYLLADFTFRFLVEFVRGNTVQAVGLTGPQLVLVPMITLLVAHFVRQARIGAWRLPPAPVPSPSDATGRPADPRWSAT